MRACVLAVLLTLTPTVVLAQAYNGAVNTSPRGGAGGAIDTRANTGVHTSAAPRTATEPPIEVRRYVEGRGDVSTTGGSLSVGQTIPGDTTINPVPGYPQWGYGVVGGQRVIINRQTGTIGGVIR